MQTIITEVEKLIKDKHEAIEFFRDEIEKERECIKNLESELTVLKQRYREKQQEEGTGNIGQAVGMNHVNKPLNHEQ